LKTNRLVIAIAFIGILLMAGRVLIDTDTWWHLRAGEWILDHRALPDVDQFSYTRQGQAWHYPGWLAEILMALVYNLAGLQGLNGLFILILMASGVLIFWTMRGNPFLRAFALVLSISAATIYWSARPQLFTFLFSAAFYLCIREFLFGKRNLLFLLPPVMVLWVNMHGGFAMGLLFLILAVLGQCLLLVTSPEERTAPQKKKLLWLVAVTAASVLAAMVNPYGLEMLFYPFRTIAIQTLQQNIQEWQSPDFHMLNAQLYLMLLLLAWAMLAISPRRPDPRDFLFLIVVGYLGFLAWRNTVFLAIVAPSIIACYGGGILLAYFPGLNQPLESRPAARMINAGLAVLLGIASVFYVIRSTAEDNIRAAISEKTPVAAVDYLAQNPGLGRLLNSYNWGGYLLWRLPAYPVFVDGRTDLFDDEIINQYLTAVNGQPGWRDVIDRWDIRLVLLSPNAPLSQILSLDGWQMRYQDSLSVILQKPAPE
jgi:hypothetical protein